MTHLPDQPAYPAADAERSQMLTKGERRRLSRYECGWCGQPLNRNSCGGIYEHCSDETRAQRVAACLAQYKPRVAKKVSLNQEPRT